MPLSSLTRPAPAPTRPERASGGASGVRGLLAALCGQHPGAECAPLPARFAAPGPEELRYAQALGQRWGATGARTARVRYAGASGAEHLRIAGVRVELSTPAGASEVERLRCESPGAARRFAVLHVRLSRGACLLEVRGDQVVVVRGALAQVADAAEVRRAAWDVLPPPEAPCPSLALARPRAGALALCGALDPRSTGLLRRLLDRSQESVVQPGAEEARAPAGAMTRAGSRTLAWLEREPRRRPASARLARALSQTPADQPATARAQRELLLRDAPGGDVITGSLERGEAAEVLERQGAWLRLARGGAALGWVLLSPQSLRLSA